MIRKIVSNKFFYDICFTYISFVYVMINSIQIGNRGVFMDEFELIINDINKNKEFLKLKNIKHHGITRYDHCFRVSYYTYLITKKLNLNYISATRAALLHDFFTSEVENEGSVKRLRKHPSIAVENAKKYFEINDLEEDIIKKHMFPVTIIPPKYLESWIVDIIDDISAIYERGKTTQVLLKTVSTFVLLFITSYIQYR